ncbi:type II secretion system protein GspJ [Palleronia rufa]|uniref:type II secretion system protein GspJ n=1 Tax=Palleronia rufa TaxID=1530186 RepID=UPI00068B1BB8|nr:type II secretion system protein GspJ [Palleronia rufa]
MSRRDPEAGVTLIETLVAVALFGLIGVAGFTMLDAMLRANGRAEAALDRVAALDLAFAVLRRDLLETDAGGLRLDQTGLRLPGARPLGYRVESGRLARTVGDPGVEQILLPEVLGAEFRVLDGARDWHSDWPPQDGAAVAAAVELTVETAAGEVATRLFQPLSTGAGP